VEIRVVSSDRLGRSGHSAGATSNTVCVIREDLALFVKALGCRDAALRRDECGDWRVSGRRGGIYAVPGSLARPKTPGFQIIVQCQSMREWSYAKKALTPFTDLTNDGDDEGTLFLDHLPTPAEAELLRQYVGIAKKREMSEAELERLKAMGHRFQKRDGVEEADQAEPSASDDDQAE
jgi:hypothetical protein